MSFSEAFKKLDISAVNDIKLTFSTEKYLEGHKRTVRSVLHFESPYNKLVSCSWDSTIRIWSSITYECEAVKKSEKRIDVTDVMKMKPAVFISCSNDYVIRSFSISSHEQMNEMKVAYTPCQLLKLTGELFLCRARSHLFILSYSRFEIIKKYETRQLGNTYHPLILSQKYPNCFYVGTNAKYDPVILIDCEKDKIVKEFTGHTTSRRIKTLSLFYNSKNEEILIACQTPEYINSYNTSHPKFNANKDINERGIPTYYQYEKIVLTCCYLLNNQFLFCGDDEGSIHAYEISEQESELRKIGLTKKSKLYYASVQYINFFPLKGNRSIRMISSERERIQITRVSGLRLKDRSSYEALDLKERIHFLFHGAKKVFYDEKKKKVVEIRMENKKLMEVWKIFL